MILLTNSSTSLDSGFDFYGSNDLYQHFEFSQLNEARKIKTSIMIFEKEIEYLPKQTDLRKNKNDVFFS